MLLINQQIVKKHKRQCLQLWEGIEQGGHVLVSPPASVWANFMPVEFHFDFILFRADTLSSYSGFWN